MTGLLHEAVYGVYAYDDSVLLYKKDYYGPPVLFVPYNMVFNYTQLVSSGAAFKDPTSTSGTILYSAHVGGYGFFWNTPACYTPVSHSCVTLPPGLYEVSYRMKLDAPLTGSAVVIQVWGDNPPRLLVAGDVMGSNFTSVSQWQTFNLFVRLDSPTIYVYVDGVNVPSAADLYVDYVTVTQIGT